ncbi:MAG: ribosome maturation factor RimP [Candidatus Izemoplasmatales bacterium]
MELNAIREAIAPAVTRMGYELYDVEFAKERKVLILRVTIDKPEGIDIDDCVAVSDVLNPLLDQLDPVQGDYSLEVTSPGAERRLRNLAEIQASIGRFVHVVHDGVKTEGVLEAADAENITLKVGSKPAVIPTPTVTLIRHAIKF